MYRKSVYFPNLVLFPSYNKMRAPADLIWPKGTLFEETTRHRDLRCLPSLRFYGISISCQAPLHYHPTHRADATYVTLGENDSWLGSRTELDAPSLYYYDPLRTRLQ